MTEWKINWLKLDWAMQEKYTQNRNICTKKILLDSQVSQYVTKCWRMSNIFYDLTLPDIYDHLIKWKICVFYF